MKLAGGFAPLLFFLSPLRRWKEEQTKADAQSVPPHPHPTPPPPHHDSLMCPYASLFEPPFATNILRRSVHSYLPCIFIGPSHPSFFLPVSASLPPGCLVSWLDFTPSRHQAFRALTQRRASHRTGCCALTQTLSGNPMPHCDAVMECILWAPMVHRERSDIISSSRSDLWSCGDQSGSFSTCVICVIEIG